MRNKRVELMGMPFTMIFSMIIIAMVIFVGFYVIKIFMERGEQVKIGLFVKELEAEVVNIWQKQEASKTITLQLTNKIQYVCFANLSKVRDNLPFSVIFEDFMPYKEQKYNMFFWPLNVAEKYKMNSARNLRCGQKECVYIEKNPTCIANVNGVIIKLTKPFDKPYVIISAG